MKLQLPSATTAAKPFIHLATALLAEYESNAKEYLLDNALLAAALVGVVQHSANDTDLALKLITSPPLGRVDTRERLLSKFKEPNQ
jgi:hypothetical protein